MAKYTPDGLKEETKCSESLNPYHTGYVLLDGSNDNSKDGLPILRHALEEHIRKISIQSNSNKYPGM